MTDMEIEQFQNLVLYLFEKTIEPLALRMTTHVVAFNAIRTVYPEADGFLAVARGDSSVRTNVHRLYHEFQEKLLQLISEESLEVEAIQEWIESRDPDDWN